MANLLFLDVDGASFSAYEMLELGRRGHAIALAAFRRLSREVTVGEFAALPALALALPRAGVGALARTIAARPRAAAAVVATALAEHRREPAYFARLVASLPWTFALARFANERRIDQIHANWAHLPATSAWIVSRLTGIPYSFSGHAGRDLFRTRSLLRAKVEHARFVVVCNAAAERRIREVAGAPLDNLHLVYHGVDLDRFRFAAPAAGASVLSVGALDPAKGFDLMIRAVALLGARGRGVRYRIAGEGSERARLESLVRELGVGDRVTLLGQVDGGALVDEYHAAAVFAAPSRILDGGGRDGLPNVVLEAMACGVPVVAADVAGIPEAVAHETTGLLVPPENPGDLAGAVERLLADRALARRVAGAARDSVVRRFDRRKNVERFCALFADSGRA